jgi:predicted enzyme related to lactoylglutathione lyase
MTSLAAAAGLARIGQIAVNVRDLDRAVAFYRDVVGLEFLFAIPNAAFFDCGGLRLMLAIAEAPEFDHAASIIYYRVDDIRAAGAALATAGAKIEAEPRLIARMPDHELWMCFFRDSEENMAAVMSEVRQ